MKVLIVGDSFAADWATPQQIGKGWPNLLSSVVPVTNLAQSGVGEYKIWKQTQIIPNFRDYDWYIVCHTSPWRLHTKQNLCTINDPLRSHADLLAADVCWHANTICGWFDPAVQGAKNYFLYHYDDEYQLEIYRYFFTLIDQFFPPQKTLIIKTPLMPDWPTMSKQLDISKWPIEDGYNHLSEKDNAMLFQNVCEYIDCDHMS